jgi:uncharacterized protein
MFQPRTYRSQFNTTRFKGFQLIYKETDLWIGVDPGSFHQEMKQTALTKIKELRRKLDEYIIRKPFFAKSLEPFHPSPEDPKEAKQMAQAAAKAGIGPMASVAGIFAREVGETLLQNYPIEEFVVENGGDIFAFLKKALVLSLFAGNSPLSGKVGLAIPPGAGKLGICTSAGTVGPSLSFGKADAVVVVCKDILVADAFATAYGNKVRSPSDIEQVTNMSEQIPEIKSIFIVCENKLGIRGDYEMKLLK